MIIVSIILCLFSIGFSIYCFNYKVNIDKFELEKYNLEKNQLKSEISALSKEKNLVNNELIVLNERKNNTQISLNELLSNISDTTKAKENLSQEAYINYCEKLDSDYKDKEKEYNILLDNLNKIYNDNHDKYLRELDQASSDLEKIRATRAAAIEAINREEQIKLNSIFYCLQIPEEDLREIKIIKELESLLRDPRPIRMLIWSTYYIKKANELCARVLETSETVTGIYKITSLKSGLSYIGQAVDIRERWRQHLKAGLGIDTPSSRKLYTYMQEEGVENFTFELLEKCKSEELNEKEKTYISLYDTYNYGLNSNTGNGKGLI